jgi:hypothetical protein
MLLRAPATLKSTGPQSKNKPEKPRPDFLLFAHATGQWAKKIEYRTRNFGSCVDPQAAIEVA